MSCYPSPFINLALGPVDFWPRCGFRLYKARANSRLDERRKSLLSGTEFQNAVQAVRQIALKIENRLQTLNARVAFDGCSVQR